MEKPIDRAQIERFVANWHLQPDGAPFSTHTSVLLPALRNGRPVMLKLTPEPDEIRGAGLLAWWQGQGAVRVLETEDGAILMERPPGTRSLVEMSIGGQDELTIDIICSVARELHRPRPAPLPPLQPIEELFEPLLSSEWSDPVVLTGKRLIDDLLDSRIDEGALHGDIQHYNILDAGDGRWVAIDPKGHFGERTYDFVNLFRNPNASIGNTPETFTRRVSQLERGADIDPQRLVRWIAAFCALCLVWDYYPQGSPDSDRELARLALAFGAIDA